MHGDVDQAFYRYDSSTPKTDQSDLEIFEMAHFHNRPNGLVQVQKLTLASVACNPEKK